MRPLASVRRPLARSSSTPAATCGARRWRWTSQKRARRSQEAPLLVRGAARAQSSEVTGRSALTASRQSPPPTSATTAAVRTKRSSSSRLGVGSGIGTPWLGAAPPTRWACGKSPPRESAMICCPGSSRLQLQGDVDHRQAGADEQHRARRARSRARRGARDRRCSAPGRRASVPEASAGSRGGRLPSASTTRSACAREPSANFSIQGRAPERGAMWATSPCRRTSDAPGPRPPRSRSAAPRGRRRRPGAGRTSSAPRRRRGGART